jgi:hypothetical protein
MATARTRISATDFARRFAVAQRATATPPAQSLMPGFCRPVRVAGAAPLR